MGSFDASRRRIRRNSTRPRVEGRGTERAAFGSPMDFLHSSQVEELRRSMGLPSGSPYAWQVWVYVATKTRADNLAALPLTLYTGSAEDPVPITDGPWYERLQCPAPGKSMADLVVALETYLCLMGEVFVAAFGVGENGDLGAGEIPAVLKVLPGGRFAEPVRDQFGTITAWRWQPTGRPALVVPAVPGRLCHLPYFNPEDPERGMSPMAAAALGIETDNLSSRWNRAFYKNGAAPVGALVAPAGAWPSPDQVEQMQREWDDRYGGPEKAGKVAVLGGGTTYQAIATSHDSQQWIAQKNWTREEVSAALRVPKIYLGQTDGVNYSTSRETRRILYENTLLPEAKWIAGKLDADIFRASTSPEARARAALKKQRVLWCAFDSSTTDALRDSQDERTKRAGDLVALGYSRNEVNAHLELGLPEIPEDEGGDARLVSFGLASLGEIASPEPIDPPTLPPALPPKTNPPAGDPPGEKPKDGEEQPPKDAPRGHRCRGMDGGRRRRLAGWLQLVTHAYAPGERAFLSVTRKHFRGIGQEILGLLTGDGRSLRTVRANPSELEFFLEQNRRAWDEALAELARPIYARSANAGVKILEHQVPKGFAVVQATNPKILRFLAEKELKLVGVNGTFIDSVRASLVEGMADQATVSELELRLQREMEIQAGRAKNIARTETASATNGTRTIAMQESEGIAGREWTTAGDDNVRETHVPLDGEVIPVTGTYQVGAATLAFPGDPSGPPDEICMCRCSEGPVLES